jgi:hypothetical protein
LIALQETIKMNQEIVKFALQVSLQMMLETVA